MITYITSIFHICTIISLIAMVALFIASIMNYQREKQHENDVKSAVRECKQSGWNFFTGDKTNTLGATCGKWEYHFTDSSFAHHVCREAIAQGAAAAAKMSDAGKGVCCFYINGNDREAHKRMLEFMLCKNLIRRRGDGAFFDTRFIFSPFEKSSLQTECLSDIKLSQFVNLKKGRMRKDI